MSPPRRWIVPLAAALSFGLSSCQTYQTLYMLEKTAPVANRLTAVTANPPNLAYQRLRAHSELNQALLEFLTAKGDPEFIVEEQRFSTHQIVMYYPKRNEAYLMRSAPYQASSTVFLGPEPIGEKDKRLFKALREVEKAAAAYRDEPTAKPRS
jgi:hypothetical protein